MLFHELSEKGKRGETHVSGDSLDCEVGVALEVFAGHLDFITTQIGR